MSPETMTLNCDCEPVIRTEIEDFTDRSTSEVIAETVAEVAGVDPLELPPLYEAVDPDAIDALFDGRDGTADLLLKFELDTWDVFIRADGKLCICDRARPIDPQPVFEESTA